MNITDCNYFRITNYNNVQTGYYRWTGCTDIISVNPVEPLQTSYVCAKDLYVEDYKKLGTEPGYCHHCHTGRCPVGVATQDPKLEKRLNPIEAGKRIKNYLTTLTLELQTLARANGKSDVRNLEPEDLAALTVEAAAMARVPLAGTDWIPGKK